MKLRVLILILTVACVCAWFVLQKKRTDEDFELKNHLMQMAVEAVRDEYGVDVSGQEMYFAVKTSTNNEIWGLNRMEEDTSVYIYGNTPEFYAVYMPWQDKIIEVKI